MKNILILFRADGNFLIIYSHGNASDLGDVYSYAVNLAILYKVPFFINPYFILFFRQMFLLTTIVDME